MKSNKAKTTALNNSLCSVIVKLMIYGNHNLDSITSVLENYPLPLQGPPSEETLIRQVTKPCTSVEKQLVKCSMPEKTLLY